MNVMDRNGAHLKMHQVEDGQICVPLESFIVVDVIREKISCCH